MAQGEMQVSAVEEKRLSPADPHHGFLELEEIHFEHRLNDNRQKKSAAPIGLRHDDVEAVKTDGILDMPGVGDLDQEQPLSEVRTTLDQTPLTNKKILAARLDYIVRLLPEERGRADMARRYHMESLRAYSENAVVELEKEEREIERQLFGGVRTQLVGDKCGGLIKSKTHFSPMRWEESVALKGDATATQRSADNNLAMVPSDVHDGAPERVNMVSAGIDQTGRMASIVVIPEHDKAKNDAASPRKDSRAEDVSEELLPPLLTLNASAQQLVQPGGGVSGEDDRDADEPADAPVFQVTNVASIREIIPIRNNTPDPQTHEVEVDLKIYGHTGHMAPPPVEPNVDSCARLVEKQRRKCRTQILGLHYFDRHGHRKKVREDHDGRHRPEDDDEDVFGEHWSDEPEIDETLDGDGGPSIQSEVAEQH